MHFWGATPVNRSNTAVALLDKLPGAFARFRPPVECRTSRPTSRRLSTAQPGYLPKKLSPPKMRAVAGEGQGFIQGGCHDFRWVPPFAPVQGSEQIALHPNSGAATIFGLGRSAEPKVKNSPQSRPKEQFLDTSPEEILTFGVRRSLSGTSSQVGPDPSWWGSGPAGSPLLDQGGGRPIPTGAYV